MAIPVLPESGFVLSPPASGGDSSNRSKLPQVIQLDLDDGLLHDIIKASRHGKNTLLSFGKSVVSLRGHSLHNSLQCVTTNHDLPSSHYTMDPKADCLHLDLHFILPTCMINPIQTVKLHLSPVSLATDCSFSRLKNSFLKSTTP